MFSSLSLDKRAWWCSSRTPAAPMPCSVGNVHGLGWSLWAVPTRTPGPMLLHRGDPGAPQKLWFSAFASAVRRQGGWGSASSSLPVNPQVLASADGPTLMTSQPPPGHTWLTFTVTLTLTFPNLSCSLISLISLLGGPLSSWCHFDALPSCYPQICPLLCEPLLAPFRGPFPLGCAPHCFCLPPALSS